MAKKRARRSQRNWAFGLPKEVSPYFTYFNDLLEGGKTTELAEAKANLAGRASAMMDVSGLGDNSEVILSAIQFLREAASSERAKEVAILTNYKKELSQKLPKNDKLDAIIARINPKNLDNPGDWESFYTDLTAAINMIRQDAEEYKKRVADLAKHNAQNFQELTRNDFRFRAYGDIQSMFNSIIGSARLAQEKEIDSFSSKMRQIVGQQIVNSGIMGQLTSGADLLAISAMLILDIESTLQKELYEAQKDDFTEFTLEEIQKVVDQYNARDEEHLSRLQRAIASGGNDLQILLNSAKDVLGIETTTPTLWNSKASERYQKEIRSVAAKRGKNKDTLYHMLAAEFGKKNSILQDLAHINFTHTSTTSHGNLYELISTMLQADTGKVSGNAATDLISFEISYELPDAEAVFKSTFDRLNKAYTQYANRSRQDDRIYEQQALARMNEEVEAVQRDLDNYLKQLDYKVPEIFVYHESLKLYAGMETGKANGKGFHGREMAITAALDQVMSANGFGSMVIPNASALELVAHNLAEGSLGSKFKGDVERLFSIFAGLLMFDDVQMIAKEATGAIDFSGVKSIHLYLLNGVYVPASMVLTFTYENLMQASEAINSGLAAKAEIKTGPADKVISNWVTTRPGPVQIYWAPTGASVAAGTTVRIAFLTGFLQFMNALTKV